VEKVSRTATKPDGEKLAVSQPKLAVSQPKLAELLPKVSSPRGAQKKETITKETIQKQYGEFKNVFLTDENYQKLTALFNHSLPEKIETLSCYKQSTGKKYKDDYATLLNWARRDNGGSKNGFNQGRTHAGTKLPPRDGYTEPPFDPVLAALAANDGNGESGEACDIGPAHEHKPGS
jgi:hypothetical protein